MALEFKRVSQGIISTYSSHGLSNGSSDGNGGASTRASRTRGRGNLSESDSLGSGGRDSRGTSDGAVRGGVGL
jgi:hypothetical protein